MKNKILQEFLNSDIEIKSQEKLEQYAKYCIENAQKEKIKSKTEYHHILPEKLFPEYKNLKLNTWNGAHLLYEHHYIAHSILAEALNNFSMISAWWGMNNLNQKSGKIEKAEEIIGPKKYSILKECFYKSVSEWHSKNPELVKIKGKKISKSKTKVFIKDDKETTIAKEAVKKGKITNNIEYLDQDGNITTLKKEQTKKQRETLLKEIIINGKKTTKAKIIGKKMSDKRKIEYLDEKGNITNNYKETAHKRKKYVDIINKRTGKIVLESVYMSEAKRISQALIKTLKTGIPLGETNQSKSLLIKNNKEWLIGCILIKKEKINERT
jgi:hypothetical protein